MVSNRDAVAGLPVIFAVVFGTFSLGIVSSQNTVACVRPQDVCDDGPDGYEDISVEEICQSVGTCPPNPNNPACSGNGAWHCYDAEDNHLWIECSTFYCNSQELLAYQYWFNGILVGACVYEYGGNVFLYKMDEEGVFECIKHRTHDDSCCDGPFCVEPGCDPVCGDDNCNNMKDWVVSSLTVGQNTVLKSWREGSCDDFPNREDAGWESGEGVEESSPDCHIECN